jgi:hypothetical protein
MSYRMNLPSLRWEAMYLLSDSGSRRMSDSRVKREGLPRHQNPESDTLRQTGEPAYLVIRDGSYRVAVNV